MTRSPSATSRAWRRRRGCTTSPRRIASCARSAACRRRGCGRPGTSAPTTMGISQDIERRLQQWGLARRVRVRRRRSIACQKFRFLERLDVLSVPSGYHEPKGLPIARSHGIGRAGRAAESRRLSRDGACAPAAACSPRSEQPADLADTLQQIWEHPTLAEELGRRGARRRPEALRHRPDGRRMIDVYREAAGHPVAAAARSRLTGGRVLEVSHLTKSYPSPAGPVTILDDVSLRLSPGESAAVMGPSGSGKSTLLYVIGALEAPTSGTVSFGGADPFLLEPSALAAFRNQQVGFVFQDHCLLPQCTVLENVLVPTLVGEPDRQAAARARSAARSGRAVTSPRPSPGGAVGRREAARRHRPRARPPAAAAALRRADRQPRRRRRPTSSPTSSCACTASSRRCCSS